ncbi:hypothetical protein FGADI_3884 [Fusarium gaditjirri]|uniref:Uncharacterized protein n=1 Tax=Fusarium gaditjirri TaxID=282569 RepID=A0A8H4TEQ4_9HYPO|nr:hypothetical protein FGADI_3884 [Fusarium gaditjirri]
MDQSSQAPGVRKMFGSIGALGSRAKAIFGCQNGVSSQLLTAPSPPSSPSLINLDKEDLRKTLSATQTKLELCHRLRTHPSLTLDIPPFGTSSVDCLVNLIRHTNAILDSRSSTQQEEDNPLLAYAWQAFFPRVVDQELTNHRITVKKAVFNHLKDRISEILTFEDCCTSLVEARRQGSVASLIYYDCRRSPNLTLEEAVNRHRTLQRTQNHFLLKKPKFVRVLYRSHAEKPKPFSDLLSFNLPVAGERVPVSLISIVRMREAIHKRDYMRTYDDGGVPLGQIETATQTPPVHSVSAKGGHSYLLVFGLGLPDKDRFNEFLPGSSRGNI